jgi:tetratricopeptide (TPR) repeat protein
MQAALRIRRRITLRPREAAAWLLPGFDTAALLGGLAELGLEPLPRVYRTAAGFFIRPDVPTARMFIGAIRLAEIAEGMFAAPDAELHPALLADEVAGVTRGGGVVCLPGEFAAVDLSGPLAAPELLVVDNVRRREWKPLPQPEPRADTITQFIYDRPGDDAESILDQGSKGIGEQEPGPEDAGAGSSMLGRAEFAAGKALSGLGRMFGSRGMQEAGSGLMGKGIERDPKRLEGLLGKQEAALRDLLRRFQEGKIDDALRRALPLGSEGGRGARASGNAALPFNNILYSLGNLLGGRGGGTSVWFTEPDVYAALVGEYRKAAEQARKDGDARRAAFIYGKLLGDYRTAANLLQQGGLHHDAAVLYLKKLNDPLSAARAYEAAGDVDEAVGLYRRIGQHVPAGDLLRKAGDEQAAIAEYERAARLMSERGEYKQAGELMMGKADAAHALPFFTQGWKLRPNPNSVPCAVHIAVIHADSGDAESLLTLTGEADRFFTPPGHEAQAAQYYNMLATLAQREALAGTRTELHDRALTGLARKLRQRPDGRQAPFDSKAWSNALVSDAQYAARTELQRRPRSTGPRETTVVSSVRIAQGRVTCAAQAAASGELFVGFEDGRIFSFSPMQGATQVRESGPPLFAIATEPQGNQLAAMHAAPDDWRDFSTYLRQRGQWRRGRGNLLLFHDNALLCGGVAQGRAQFLICETNQRKLMLRQGEGLEPYVDYDLPEDPIAAALTGIGLLLVSDRNAFWLGNVNAMRTVTKWQEAATHWRPSGLIAGAELAIRQDIPGQIEIAGRNEHGSLYWSGLTAGTFGLRCESRVVAARGDYLCAALTQPGKVAGVTATHVNWFHKDGEGFALKSITQVAVPDAVGCFHSADTGELLVLSADGRVSMVTVH